MGNVVLTGLMGTGKSTVGRKLAREFGLKFLDMDELIEKEAGLSIKDIFAKFGEPHFRSLERALVKELTGGGFGDGLIVATGGGAVVDRGSRDALRKWGKIICLSASPEEILERVGGTEKRPLLTGREDKRKEIEKLLEERKGAYLDCDLTIDTTGKSVQEVVGEIKRFLS